MSGNRVRPRLGLRVALGALAVAAVFTDGAVLVGAENNHVGPVSIQIIYSGVVVGASLLTLARGIDPTRRRWALIGIASLMWAAGSTYFTFDGAPPSPSIGDLLWLALYPPLFWGVLALARQQAGVDRRLWLDGVVGALAVMSATALIVFVPVAHTASGSMPAVVVNLAYPLADSVLLGLALVVLVACRGRASRNWLILGLGVVVFTVADSVYLFEVAHNSYKLGDPVDIGWLSALVMFTFAAWYPPRPAAAPRDDAHSSLAVPLILAIIPIVCLGVRQPDVAGLPSVVLACLALVGVLLRLFVTHRDLRGLLATMTKQALTDDLTGLGNRQLLLRDIQETLNARRPGILMLFDLDGFKTYNDSYGHLAGDALLRTLTARLAESCKRESARAYRMGGDEFCVLAPRDDSPQRLLARLRAAMYQQGEGFTVRASAGAALIGAEANSVSELLRLVDARMYAEKNGNRPGAALQAKNVLVRALCERRHELEAHLSDVGGLTAAVCRELGLDEAETERVTLSAELHDIGKVAIPDAILAKPGPLNEAEWEFMRQHTVIGQRIVSGAPALRALGPMIRSTHERWDGSGYPDGLAGEKIPLGAQIIFVCDAYDAMTSERVYSAGMSAEAAVAELRRCAGTQFSPRVVRAFCAAHEALEAADRGMVPSPKILLSPS